MSERMNIVIFPVRDLAAAKALYGTLLGVAPSMDQPYYVGFDADGLHVGLDPNGHGKGMTGPVPFWRVEDIRGSVDALVAAGGQVREDVHEVGGGRRIASVRDADGNEVGVYQDS